MLLFNILFNTTQKILQSQTPTNFSRDLIPYNFFNSIQISYELINMTKYTRLKSNKQVNRVELINIENASIKFEIL
jgi:hypothetical protein